MIKKETGASFLDEAPANQVTAVKQITYNNSSALKENRKHFEQSLFGDWPYRTQKISCKPTLL